jgi:4-diphosphocytidyl-2-C-methyl-D-erythritol kinase
MLIDNLYDEISFIKSNKNQFDIDGNFSCPLEKNTIYEAYKAILNYTNNKDIEQFFKEYSISIKKNIPEFAGLGGGSSNSATFFKMLNNKFNLKLTIQELAQIGLKVGADIPFFIYGYNSANVSGIGEIIKPFDENSLNLKIITPKIQCNTKEIYQIFREKFYKELDSKNKNLLENIKSVEFLEEYNIEFANDLYNPAKFLKPELKNYKKDGWFFSGSGSSFFTGKDGK